MDSFTTMLAVIAATILAVTVVLFALADDKKAVDGWLVFGIFLAFTVFMVPWALWTHYEKVGWDQWKLSTAENISNWLWAAVIFGPIAFVIAVLVVKVKVNQPK